MVLRTSSAFQKIGRLHGFSHFRSAGLEMHLLWVSLFIVVSPESCGIYLNVFSLGMYPVCIGTNFLNIDYVLVMMALCLGTD